MGRFEFVPGVEKEGSPVYRQAHSREVPSDWDYRLFRWGKPSYILLLRSGNEWWVKTEGYAASLKASVGDDPNVPPTTGWKFSNGEAL